MGSVLQRRMGSVLKDEVNDRTHERQINMNILPPPSPHLPSLPTPPPSAAFTAHAWALQLLNPEAVQRTSGDSRRLRVPSGRKAACISSSRWGVWPRETTTGNPAGPGFQREGPQGAASRSTLFLGVFERPGMYI